MTEKMTINDIPTQLYSLEGECFPSRKKIHRLRDAVCSRLKEIGYDTIMTAFTIPPKERIENGFKESDHVVLFCAVYARNEDGSGIECEIAHDLAPSQIEQSPRDLAVSFSVTYKDDTGLSFINYFDLSDESHESLTTKVWETIERYL